MGALVGREKRRSMCSMTWNFRATVEYTYDVDIAEFRQAFGG
jgi:hypothetical protein